MHICLTWKILGKTENKCSAICFVLCCDVQSNYGSRRTFDACCAWNGFMCVHGRVCVRCWPIYPESTRWSLAMVAVNIISKKSDVHRWHRNTSIQSIYSVSFRCFFLFLSFQVQFICTRSVGIKFIYGLFIFDIYTHTLAHTLRVSIPLAVELSCGINTATAIAVNV